MKYLKSFNESLVDVKPKKGGMHKFLNVPEGETIKSVYPDPKEMAEKLLKKVKDRKKVTGMLAFAANISSKDSYFKRALKALKNID